MDDSRNERGTIARQGITYLAVGVGTALLELVLFRALLFFGMNAVLANVEATVIATCVNFLLNRGVTFGEAERPVRSAFLYLLLFLANMYVSSTVIVGVMSMGVPAVVAKGMMQLCVAAWNFVLYRKVVFR